MAVWYPRAPVSDPCPKQRVNTRHCYRAETASVECDDEDDDDDVVVVVKGFADVTVPMLLLTCRRSSSIGVKTVQPFSSNFS